MADFDRFERALGVALRLDAEAGAIPFDPREIAGVAIERGREGRLTTIRRAATSPQVRWLLAAALLAAALVAILLGAATRPVPRCDSDAAGWQLAGATRQPSESAIRRDGLETNRFSVGDPNGFLGAAGVTVAVTTAPLGTGVPVSLGSGQPARTIVVSGDTLEAIGASIETGVPGARRTRSESRISGEPALRYAGVDEQTYVGPLAAVAVTIYGDRVFVATEYFALDAPFDAMDEGRFESFLATVRFIC